MLHALKSRLTSTLRELENEVIAALSMTWNDSIRSIWKRGSG